MNVHRYAGQVLKKSFFVLLLVLLIFQSFGINGLAAGAASPFTFQQGGDPQALTCTLPLSPTTEDQTPTFCNIQIVLMIDDSGSMTNNDPQKKPNGGLRNQGAKNLVDLLATQYYLPAIQLIEKLNSENPDRKIQLPVVQVAVIHFTNQVKNTNLQWMNVAPGSLEEWTTDPKKGQKAIYDVIDLEYAYLYQLTSFTDPFEKARQLFESSAPGGDCTQRSIMLFTDGVPEDNNGPLKDTTSDKKLTRHMDAVADTVNRIQENQRNQNYPDDVEIYVTGFKVEPTYWTPVEAYWVKIATPSSGDDIPEHTMLLEGENALAQLPSRMEEIAAKFTGLQREEHRADSFSTEVPTHVQTLRFTLFNLDPKATLVITGPNGQAITANDSNVTVTGDESAIEKWDLNIPLPGSYQIKATKTGGIITSLLTYQNLTVEFDPEPARLQASKQNDLKFKLMDSTGNVVLPNGEPTVELKIFVTQNDQTQELPWTLSDDQYQVSWTPARAGDSHFNIEANLVNGNRETLLNCQGIAAERPVDPIGPAPTVVVPVEPTLIIYAPASCVPSGEVITVPVRLESNGDDLSWLDTLKWNVSATATPASGNVHANLKTVNANTGDYEVSIDPVEAEKISLVVSAVAEIGGQQIKVSADKVISFCQPPPPCDCFPIWLIFIWLLMGLCILLFGWLVLRDRGTSTRSWILIVLEVILAVIWFILFSAYRVYLLWMLFLLAILLIFLFLIYRRETREIVSWWLIIVLTLFVSIWFIVFGAFPFWLILLVLLLWLVMLVVIWIFSQDRSSRMLWILLALLLILALLAIIYYSTYWMFLLLWLLVVVLVIVVIRVIGPICPSPAAGIVYVDRYNDYLTLIEGIGDDVEEILHEHGIRTYSELSNTKTADLKDWLKKRGFPYNAMDPTTWPEQARLAEESKKSGDWTELVLLINELIVGRKKDRSKKPDKGSRKSPTSRTKKTGGGAKPPKKPK